MRILDTPKVYLIARPQIVEEGLIQFLLDQKLAWPTPVSGVSDAERLVEVAGRCCYMSFGKKAGSKTNKKYIQNLLGREDNGSFKPGPAHGSVCEHPCWSFLIVGAGRGFCYDANTEVLTNEGWKFWEDIRGDELFATLNLEKDELEYQNATNVIRQDYKGLMYSIRSKMVDLLVTPNHRMLYFPYDKRINRNWKIDKAVNLFGKRVQYKRNVSNWNGMQIEKFEIPLFLTTQRISNQYGSYGIKDIACEGKIVDASAFAEFLGYWLAEGSLDHSKDGGYFVTLYQNDNTLVLENMKQCVERLGYTYSIHDSGTENCKQIRINGGRAFYEFLKPYSGVLNKRIPREIKSWSKSLLIKIIEKHMDGDGSWPNRGSGEGHTVSKNLADDLQELALKCGFSATVRRVDRRNEKPRLLNGKLIKHNHIVYVVSYCKVRNEPLVNHNGKRHDCIVDYDGKIYCVTVPNGLLYVRRNGRPVWCGNSHEQVRHRVGWAYCLSGETEIYSERFLHGKRNGCKKRKIKDLFAMTKTSHGRSRIKLLKLRCFDEVAGVFTTDKVRNITYSGQKPVFNIKLKDGKCIKATAKHKFLIKNQGWKSLEEVVNLRITDGGIAVYDNVCISLGVNGVCLYKNKDWLYQKYYVDNLKLYDIAILANVSVHTIRKWLRLFKLSKPLKLINQGRIPWNKGKRYTSGWHHNKSTLLKLSNNKKGSKNPQWKGGITKVSSVLRREVNKLRTIVYSRDNYKCRVCGNVGGELTLHHIIPIWADKSLVNDIGNIATVCSLCHYKINGKELDYIEAFNNGSFSYNIDSLKELQKIVFSGPPKMSVKYVELESINYCGQEDTYDIEMENIHNFVANGIITHNSQLSTRYCDFEREEEEGTWEPGFCIPPLAQLSEETSELFKIKLQESQKSYCVLLKKIETDLQNDEKFMITLSKYEDREKKRMLRKAARGAARDILPIATEAILVMSANARAIWNCIYLRANEHAEAVIREVYVQIAKIMEKEMPALFNGLKYEKCWDGSEVVIMPRDKI